MSAPQVSPPAAACPPSLEELQQQIHQRLDAIIAYCLHEQGPTSFLDFETTLLGLLRSLGCLLIQLFLHARHGRQDLTAWTRTRGYRVAAAAAPRTLKTSCGPVTYRRAFLLPRRGGGPGVHPLDIALGLTRDAYSPLVIGWFCRLATRVSFQLASGLGGMFLGTAPPASAIEEWVLGLGRPAYVYLSDGPLPRDEGEVLVIEIDGKAAPTATPQELARRRRPRSRHRRGCHCGCQRHRGRARRKHRGRKSRRKKGDKSKNGRSATLVVMYTLRRGDDGRWHGPCNKKVYGTFGARRAALNWARAQATRRGFPPKTDKAVQIVIDGETCLEQRLRRLFPGAILTLDIRHAQEKLWEVGRLFHREGSAELTRWVEELEDLLYKGHVRTLLRRLEQEFRGVSRRGPGTKEKRKTLKTVIAYLEARVKLMDYGRWRKEDLVIATGVVEGAARYVVGERLDNSGMRWSEERAEAVLLLRCIEVNGDWEEFTRWSQEQRSEKLGRGEVVQIRSKTP
ncbi:MAG TPA: hypothetical protein VKP69_06475, partial [Isosphaeraceae bacterium]|nr:hypothetical protein [Isosphaeraceae bacterium]